MPAPRFLADSAAENNITKRIDRNTPLVFISAPFCP
jgi:hypothetical protein